MTKSKFHRFLVAAALFAGVAVAAQAQTFKVATGDSHAGSTYSQMFRELQSRCGQSLGLQERETHGSVENIDLLTGNQVNAAIVQSDMLFFTKMTDAQKVEHVKTLFSLAPEELHFIARADVKTEGGYLGGLIGGKKVVFRSVEDLAGRNVGAVGGSVLSGRVFSAQSGLKFNVLPFKDNTELTKALLDGTIDTALYVAGAPAKSVQGLDGRFRVLPVPSAIAQKVSGVYSPAKLSYANLNAAGVPTVATQALFVSREYHSQALLTELARLRSCFAQHLGDIQDATGTHPKWQQVDANDKGKWTYYELPAVK